jgi:transcriptional regulator
MGKAPTTLNLDANIKEKVVAKVFKDGTSMTAVINELLERWVKGDIKLEDKLKQAA